ncbi:MAG: SDR family NAD(P)-dependent oxidoreductase, partial [Myxococcota bacterium]
GVFSLDDALDLVYERARLFATLPAGAMLSVGLAEDELAPLLGSDVAIAASNAPDQCVVAGHVSAIDTLAQSLADQAIEFRRIPIDVAAHSPAVDPILPEFSAFVERLERRPPTIPFVSSTTGAWITADEATSPAYWTRHLRHTVRFARGAATLLEHDDRVLLEVGPGRALGSLIKRQATPEQRRAIIASMRVARDPQPDQAALLSALGQLWLCGVAVDWSRLGRDRLGDRVPLPGYPFEHQRYWLDAHALASRGDELPKRPDLADWLYAPSWRRAPNHDAAHHSAALGTADQVLLFADPHGLGDALATRLNALGCRITTVHLATTADGPEPDPPDRHVLAADDRAGLTELWQNLLASGRRPTLIVHLWNVGQPAYDHAQARASLADQRAELAHHRALAFDSVLALGQSIGMDGHSDRVRLSVVSTGVHAVTGTEALCPARALLLGPCRVIPLELVQVSCQNIDIEPPGDAAARARTVDALIGELCAPERTSVGIAGPDQPATSALSTPLVALRGRYRWVPDVEPTPPPPALPDPGSDQAGVYLITGGLGDIGLALAESLAEWIPGVGLALLGRRARPERAERVQAMRARGARVELVLADVADRAAVDTALARVRERLGAIRGVIHAAGVPSGGLLQIKSPDSVDGIFAPKVIGTLNLLDALAENPPEFALLFSSLTAVTGDIG